jgi:hypothetical protein
MSQKRLILLLLPFFIAAFAEAQSVKVTQEKARIKGENQPGYETALEGTLKEVTSSFEKQLRSLGKIKLMDGVYQISNPTLDGTTYPSPLYAVVKENAKGATVWMGVVATEWKDADAVGKSLESFLHEFGVKFYRDKIQAQVDESTRALQTVEKQQQRLMTENKNLNTKLEDNKREKIQLEKSLENNKLEYETLLKKIEQNKKAQDSIAIANEQIKKVVEMHKERQKKVN